jgi:uncharacterized protein (DUF3084 family)
MKYVLTFLVGMAISTTAIAVLEVMNPSSVGGVTKVGQSVIDATNSATSKIGEFLQTKK